MNAPLTRLEMRCHIVIDRNEESRVEILALCDQGEVVAEDRHDDMAPSLST